MGDKSAISKKEYLDELDRLTVELVKMQEWIKVKGLKVVVLFEGRDAAGKGGVISAITGGLNPRGARIAALGVPSEREKSQWYFQRYAAQLPSAGELVFFDRSWYNRAGVERVMGFCTNEEYDDFALSVPEFERMLIRSGIILVKYWFSVSDEVHERSLLVGGLLQGEGRDVRVLGPAGQSLERSGRQRQVLRAPQRDNASADARSL
jgi:polyphosphate kinase 2 (PPK2 family)